MKNIKTIMQIVGLNLSLLCAAAANLITNGDFEAQNVASGTYTNLTWQTQGLTGWTIVYGSIDLCGENIPGLPGTNTTQYIDLCGLGDGGISQTITTVQNTTYTLSFRYAKNTLGGSGADAGVTIQYLNGTPAKEAEPYSLIIPIVTSSQLSDTNAVQTTVVRDNSWATKTINFTTPATGGTSVAIRFQTSFVGTSHPPRSGGILVDDVSVQ